MLKQNLKKLSKTFDGFSYSFTELFNLNDKKVKKELLKWKNPETKIIGCSFNIYLKNICVI